MTAGDIIKRRRRCRRCWPRRRIMPRKSRCSKRAAVVVVVVVAVAAIADSFCPENENEAKSRQSRNQRWVSLSGVVVT